MHILMATNMAKNIFKDSSLNNFTSTTKKRYWYIVPGILTKIIGTEQDINDIISCLDPQKASGPDDISHRNK
jgi:hypothetical protein